MSDAAVVSNTNTTTCPEVPGWLDEAISPLPDGPLDAGVIQRLSWWKATYQIANKVRLHPDTRLLTGEERADFARGVAFAMWLHATGRIDDWMGDPPTEDSRES